MLWNEMISQASGGIKDIVNTSYQRVPFVGVYDGHYPQQKPGVFAPPLPIDNNQERNSAR
jgi:hypothetical protein